MVGRGESPALAVARRECVDRFGQRAIAVGDPAGIVTGEAEIDAVPHAGEFGMVIDRLGMRGNAGEEGERFGEILEPKAFHERVGAAGLLAPALWYLRRARP